VPTVPVGRTLGDALAALLTSDAGHVVVTSDDRPIGALTASSIYATARRRADGAR